jgi:hypothetical protein
MRRIALIVVLVVVLLLCFTAWKLQPLMRPGTTVFLVETNAGGFQMQIWQRKNTEILEPFSTKLLVKRDDRRWVYSIDHQDVYKPPLTFATLGKQLVIRDGSKPVAYFDIETGFFRKKLGGIPFTPMTDPDLDLESERRSMVKVEKR